MTVDHLKGVCSNAIQWCQQLQIRVVKAVCTQKNRMERCVQHVYEQTLVIREIQKAGRCRKRLVQEDSDFSVCGPHSFELHQTGMRVKEDVKSSFAHTEIEVSQKHLIFVVLTSAHVTLNQVLKYNLCKLFFLKFNFYFIKYYTFLINLEKISVSLVWVS